MPGLPAFGTLLKMGDGADPEVFTTIARIMTINGPGISKDPLEVTSHDSPGGWKEFVGNLKDGGEFSLELNYDPAEATHNRATGVLGVLVDESQPTNFQLVFPDDAATTWTLSALVTSFEPAAPHDGKLSASVTLKVSGEPTLA